MNRVVRVVLAGTALIALPALIGCSGTAASLEGTSWRVTGWSVSSLDPNGFTITATFSDGGIGGTSAVNSYGGKYKTGPGNAFSVSEIVSTLIAGPEPANTAERTYFELLDKARRYTLEDDTLTLTDEAGNELLTFGTLEYLPD